MEIDFAALAEEVSAHRKMLKKFLGDEIAERKAGTANPGKLANQRIDDLDRLLGPQLVARK